MTWRKSKKRRLIFGPPGMNRLNSAFDHYSNPVVKYTLGFEKKIVSMFDTAAGIRRDINALLNFP